MNVSEVSPVSLLEDCGSVTGATRGVITEWPWYEMSAPPFNHYCPVCGSTRALGESSMLQHSS